MVRPYLPEGFPVRFRSAANRLSHPSGGLLPRAAGRFLLRAKSSAGVLFFKNIVQWVLENSTISRGPAIRGIDSTRPASSPVHSPAHIHL